MDGVTRGSGVGILVSFRIRRVIDLPSRIGYEYDSLAYS